VFTPLICFIRITPVFTPLICFIRITPVFTPLIYFIKVSAVNHSVSAIFLHLYDGGLCWVFKGKLANITKLNQALTDDATIRHISLVGCNLDNPTDNSTSTYAAQTLQNLKEIGVTSTSARSDYVAIGPDGRKPRRIV
jgi:hypothetical protein